jgi:iron complex outermembrane receptor protein
MRYRWAALCTASAISLIASVANAKPIEPQDKPTTTAMPADASTTTPPSGQDSPAGNDPKNAPSASDKSDAGDIVVTGMRQSLERAAEIKRNSVQIVDSVVAQDIGKLPDPTTAAALQRVPGVQVSVNRNNELGDVRVRGLPDILTTVNGREVFTTTGRTFDLQDLPAEALSRVDVYKSQTADLTEGGLAGSIDLKLNRPFNFTKPTAVLSARGNYGQRIKSFDPQFGILLTNRWDTPVGEIGLLANGTFSRSNYYRAQTLLRERRSTATTPFNTPGIVLPTIFQSFPETGFIERQQFNASAQWKASSAITVYSEGFYTYFRDRGAHVGANIQPFTTGVSLSNVQLSNRCFTSRVLANGQNPTITTSATGVQALQPYTVQNLCEPDQVTFNNLVVNQTSQNRDLNQRNKQIAGGTSYDQGGLKLNLDASFQRSRFDLTNITVDVGQRVATAILNDDGDAHYTLPGNALLTPDNLYIRNALIQTYTRTRGSLFQTKFDGERDFDGFLKKIQVGFRYARREANQDSVNLNTAIPGGNLGTATEATAVKVSATGLPNDFLSLSTVGAPDLNNGSRFYIPSTDFILSDRGINALRAYFRLPQQQPAFQPERQFRAAEKTIAGYAQISYELPLGGDVRVDGVVGTRLVQTDRTIATFRPVTSGSTTTYLPVSAVTTDRDFLPNATARLRVGPSLQFRVGYQRSLRRPNFADLNPTVTLTASNNPLVQPTGAAGNPDLKPQKSSSYDATAEYYFRGGYLSIAGYYRDISNRVIGSSAVETFNGVDYAINRPRNVGKATLKGVEVSTQYFFDFLPGALSGLGVQGAFTYADSKIGGNDPLAGNPLQGVSKYNFTAGLLYDKHGWLADPTTR